MPRVPLTKLHPAPWNPRQLKDARFQNLCKSIEADPGLLDLRPILATKDGTIYGGNQRFRAVQHLGWTDVPAVLSDIPEQLAKERALKDNGAWGEWVEDDLGTLLADLKAAGSDIDLLGFDSPELDRLLKGVTQMPEEDEADLEPPAEPITKPGDLWLLGEHRLLCGDSTNTTDVERLMNGRKADMVFTDPPYGVGYDGGMKKRELLAGDHLGTSVYADALPLLKVAAADHAALYLWYADAHAAAAAAAAAGYETVAQIIWVKNNAQFVTSAKYHGKHEICFYAHRKGHSAAWYGPNNEVTVWNVDRASVNEYHPTQKPIELAVRAITNSSKRGDIVLDLFGGSGSTLIAAEQTDRIAYLMEIDPGYVQVILERWAKLTGKDPIRDDGMSFRSLKAGKMEGAAVL